MWLLWMRQMMLTLRPSIVPLCLWLGRQQLLLKLCWACLVRVHPPCCSVLGGVFQVFHRSVTVLQTDFNVGFEALFGATQRSVAQFQFTILQLTRHSEWFCTDDVPSPSKLCFKDHGFDDSHDRSTAETSCGNTQAARCVSCAVSKSHNHREDSWGQRFFTLWFWWLAWCSRGSSHRCGAQTKRLASFADPCSNLFVEWSLAGDDAAQVLEVHDSLESCTCDGDVGRRVRSCAWARLEVNLSLPEPLCQAKVLRGFSKPDELGSQLRLNKEPSHLYLMPLPHRWKTGWTGLGQRHKPVWRA